VEIHHPRPRPRSLCVLIMAHGARYTWPTHRTRASAISYSQRRIANANAQSGKVTIMVHITLKLSKVHSHSTTRATWECAQPPPCTCQLEPSSVVLWEWEMQAQTALDTRCSLFSGWWGGINPHPPPPLPQTPLLITNVGLHVAQTGLTPRPLRRYLQSTHFEHTQHTLCLYQMRYSGMAWLVS
jgi:hypothetical protein